MSRSLGLVDALQGVLPGWFAIVLALLTQLGDLWFLGLLLAALFWRLPRRRVPLATLAGLFLGGIGLYRTLKELFALPRPQQPLLASDAVAPALRPFYEATAMASSYGFPSGHATSTSIVYFGLAGAIAIGSRRRRYAVAATLVAVVSFTRVALGVHYLVDVVAGVALGSAFLVAGRRAARRLSQDPAAASFALALVLSVLYVIASGVHGQALLMTSLAVVCLLGWLSLDRDRLLSA